MGLYMGRGLALVLAVAPFVVVAIIIVIGPCANFWRFLNADYLQKVPCSSPNSDFRAVSFD